MGAGATTPGAMEITATLQQLVATFEQHGPSEELLPLMQRAMIALKVKVCERSYRNDFTENYVRLFGNDWNYRPEILNAALLQSPDLWVNGRVHYISAHTMRRGRRLTRCFMQLCELLASPEGEVGVLLCSRLARALSVFESEWVQFEEAYVQDLIRIETLARIPLERAVGSELRLVNLEHAKFVAAWASEGPQAPVHLPVPLRRRRRLSSSDVGASSRGSGSATQLSLPQHHRSPMGSPQFGTSEDSFRESASGFGYAECPRSRQQTLSGEASMAGAAAAQGATDGHSGRKAELRHLAESACSAARHSHRRKLLEDLMSRVCDLNACANASGKGRSDMTVNVLEAAADIFLQKEDDPKASSPEKAVKNMLARSVLEGFLKIRHYLSDVIGRLLWIDPQLASNEDLQVALMAWEEAWELGSSVLLGEHFCNALCGIAVEVAKTCEREATLATMVDVHDAELFLVLPRLVLLSGLRTTSHMALAKSILPDLEVTALQVPSLCDGIESSGSSSPRSSCTSVSWDVLMAQAIQGPGSAKDPNLEAFLLELETLSMQLQRKQPEHWNRCSSILLRCLSAVR